MWRVYDQGKEAASVHMTRDAERFRQLSSCLGAPEFHSYSWLGPTLSVGILADVERLLNLTALQGIGCSWVRRPTGGGALWHLEDCCFSIVLPASHPLYTLGIDASYHALHQVVCRAIYKTTGIPVQVTPQAMGSCDAAGRRFCMVTPSRYDLWLHGRKVGGSAQRRSRWGLLHQVSISLLRTPPSWVEQMTRLEETSVQQHHAYAGALLEGCFYPSAVPQAIALRKELHTAVAQEILDGALEQGAAAQENIH